MANPKGEIILINNQEIKLIPLGYCACGCGGKTTIAKGSNYKKNIFKGKPFKYIRGHCNFKNGRNYYKGYLYVLSPEHHRANNKGYVGEHILICEKALGKPLPIYSEIHHMNGIKDDNKNSNLVICHDRSYHMLLHRRQKAFEACNHTNWRKCWICKQYDDPNNLILRHGKAPEHKKCKSNYENNRQKYVRLDVKKTVP